MISYLQKIIFLSAICFNCLLACGQEGLLVKNNKNGKAWVYEKGAKITYIKFHEDEYNTGILNALLDTSAVILGKDTVLLSDIAGIRKKSPVHIFIRALGIPLMLLGSFEMADGAAFLYNHPESNDGIQVFLLGAGFFALGYLPYQIGLKDLTIGIGGTWSVAIFRLKPLPQ